jgi:hypothetical protein
MTPLRRLAVRRALRLVLSLAPFLIMLVLGVASSLTSFPIELVCG